MPADLVASLKDFYTKMEEKWYSLVDKVNEHIPVYSVVDAIDKVVPSFVVFLLLSFLIVFGLVFFIFSSFFQPINYEFVVVDENTQPLPYVNVNFVSGGVESSGSTDETGHLIISLREPKVKITMEATTDFEAFSTELIAQSDTVNELRLTRKQPELLRKFITLIDQGGATLSQPAIISFFCTQGTNAPQTIRVENGTEFFVDHEKSCEELSATVSSEGFLDKTVVLSSVRTQIVLEGSSISLDPGQVLVKVIDDDTGKGVSEVTVRLIKTQPIESEVDSGRTNSSGDYSFEATPGVYVVRVFDLEEGRYKSGESSEFELTEGGLESITIELGKNESDRTKIIAKVIDEDTEGPISSATVVLFDGNKQVEKKTTGTDGTVSFFGLDGENNYFAVVFHSEFVLKVFEELSPVESFSTEPVLLGLKKADSTNSGTIRAQVIAAEDKKPINLAKVFLKTSGYDFSLLDGTTDSNGFRVFQNISPGNYFLQAESSGAYGSTSPFSLSAGQSLDVNVEVLLKQGYLKVSVFDENALKISGSSVQVIDLISGDVIKEAQTGSSGSTDKLSLPWNKAIYVKVSQSGFLDYYSRKISMVPDGTREISLQLVRDNGLSGFDVAFRRVLEENLSVAQSMAANKNYWVEFVLVVPQSGFSAIEAVSRTGLQSEINAADSNFVIIGAERPLNNVGVAFSQCFDSNNDFATCSPTDSAAKQMNLSFNSLEKGVYEFAAKTFVKPFSNARELLELRFGAKSQKDGQFVRKPSTGLYLRQFVLGDRLSCDAGPPMCPDFGFLFWLTDKTGLDFSGKKQLSGGQSVNVFLGLNYELEYSIFNQAKPRRAFSDFEIVFDDILDSNAIEINPVRVRVPLLEPDTSFSGAPIALNMVKESSLAALQTELLVNSPSNKATVSFSVQPRNFLSLDISPRELTSNVVNYIGVKVTDQISGASVKRAVIKLADNKEMLNPLLVLDSSDENGFYVLETPLLNADTNVYIKVEAFNYYDSNVETVHVISALPQIDLIEEPVDCLTIDDGLSDTELELRIFHGRKANFSILTKNCPAPVEVYLFQKAASSPMTLENLATLLPLSEAVSPSFTLSQNEKIELRISADQLIGEYAVFVRTKFASDKDFRDTAKIRVLVLPTSGSCYLLDKTAFDILPRDSGVVSNNCFVGIRDPFSPRVLLGSDKAVLDSVSQKAFSNISFKSTTKVFGPMAELGKDLRIVKISVQAPDAIQIDEEEIVQKSLIDVITQLLAMCGVFGRSPIECFGMIQKHPYILILLVGMSSQEQVSQELGPSDPMSCEACPNSASLDERILLGTDVQSVVLKHALFDDGGYLAVNLEELDLGTVISSGSERDDSEDGGTGNVTLGTGLQVLQFGGGFGSGMDGGGLGGLLGGFGGMDFGGLLCNFLPFLCGGQQAQPEDTCVGHKIESDDCAALELGTAEAFGIPVDISEVACTDLSGVPMNLTNRFTGLYNSIGLFVCNKVNEGKAEIELEIKDSVDFSEEKTHSFVPVQDKIEELGVINQVASTFLFDAPTNAALSSEFLSDNPEVEVFFDGAKLRGLFIGANEPSSDISFEILNTSLEGEEFAVLGFDSYSTTDANALDVLYLVDSSKSFAKESLALCQKISELDLELGSRKLDVRSHVYVLQTDSNNSIGCADEAVGWGDSTEPSETGVVEEAWGAGLQEALLSIPWRQNAKHFAIVFTDTTATGNGNDSSDTESTENFDENSSNEESGPVVGIIANAITSALDKNVSVGFVFGVPLETQSALQEFLQVTVQTNGFTKSFQPSGDEKLIADLILKSVFKKQHTDFHIRLSGGSVQQCRGPGGITGNTGENALPRVMLSWAWEDIAPYTCDQKSGSSSIVYCDATQFTKEIVKKLSLIKSAAEQQDFSTVNNLTSFNAFLLKDSFSEDFFTDFNSFVMQKEFFPLSDYVSQWSRYIGNETRFYVNVDGQSAKALPATGLYQVNLNLDFVDPNNWVFFSQNSEPLATIEVSLKLVKALDSTNPFYSIPFDGMVGLSSSNMLNRNGYGAGYLGESIIIVPQTDARNGVFSYPVNGTGVMSVNVSTEDSFDYLNTQNEGVLLSVENSSGNVELVFSPSVATPVMLEAVSGQGSAKAFYELRKDDESFGELPSLNEWTGAASTVLECKDFEGADLPLDKADSRSSTCALKQGVGNAYGFSWSPVHSGRIFLKSIFYTPTSSFSIRNACQSESLVITPSASSSETPLKLDFTNQLGEVTVAKIFDLVKEEKVCVGEEENKVRFWWNKAYLYAELQKNAGNYFNEITGTDESFRQCVVD